MYRSGWAANAEGMPVDEQPDFLYGRSVANGWRENLLMNEPHLSDVDAIISDPKDGTQFRGLYSRLTLPVPAPGGGTMLLSASLLDPKINLRVHFQEQDE